MGKLERQQQHKDFLHKIDTALEDNVPIIERAGSSFLQSTGDKKDIFVSHQEIKDFGDDIYSQGTPIEQNKLSALKNAAKNLVLVDSPGKEFPQSEQFRSEYKTLQKRHKEYKAMVAKDSVSGSGWKDASWAIDADYRTFRDKSLSHVISTPQKEVPEWLRGMSTKIGELYSALEEDYRSRKSAPGE